uniref:Cysteine/serine-rich nuclear protein 1 n=1 Tax=Ciona intestinalis TaxID=7719 RepID=F7BNT4_CIOIN|nr:cysteine/serine-rich nuclear protein 1 [Ciona intestinalis]|eukprot:XP_002128379.1 cysteine/serine-rich nuclear protein 1 [Ciona intestinalis]
MDPTEVTSDNGNEDFDKTPKILFSKQKFDENLNEIEKNDPSESNLDCFIQSEASTTTNSGHCDVINDDLSKSFAEKCKKTEVSDLNENIVNSNSGKVEAISNTTPAVHSGLSIEINDISLKVEKSSKKMPENSYAYTNNSEEQTLTNEEKLGVKHTLDNGVEDLGVSEELSAESFNSNPSPNSNDELSLDSGIVSLDDQEADKMNPNEMNPSNNRKRLRSSLVSDQSAKRERKLLGKKVMFEKVKIFFFPRKQSFITVPSQGGSTLGMDLKHNGFKELTLEQHKISIARRRRLAIKEHDRQQRIESKLRQLRQTYPNHEHGDLISMIDEPELVESDSSSDEIDQPENDDYFFLQPIPTKKRRFMLRMSGVQKIDSEEKLTNRLTRESREVCGCDCVGVCSPATCQCSIAGIPCQVDRESFPCGCLESGCSNNSGRVEFDASRVRNHYLKTMGRLRIVSSGILPQDTLAVPTTALYSPYVESMIMTSQSQNNGQVNHHNYTQDKHCHQVAESWSNHTEEVESNTIRFTAPENISSRFESQFYGSTRTSPLQGGSEQRMKLEPIASFLSTTNQKPASNNKEFILDVIGQPSHTQPTNHAAPNVTYCGASPTQDCAIVGVASSQNQDSVTA